MEERRRFIRYSTQRQAQYFLNERKREGQECTIINVRGMLKWIEKKGDILYGGIELSEILSDVKFSKLG